MNDSGKYIEGIPFRFVHQLFLLIRRRQFSQSLLATSILESWVVIGDHFSDETRTGFLQRKWVHRANGQTPRQPWLVSCCLMVVK